MKNKSNKKGIMVDAMTWFFLGIIALVLGILIIFILKDKGIGALKKISELLHFGR